MCVLVKPCPMNLSGFIYIKCIWRKFGLMPCLKTILNCFLLENRASKWQCRLIFESKFWKNFKVNNHHSGVTYGCTGKYLTVEKFFFQSLPRHLADTVEDVKNQPHGRWKIVFLIIQRKWPKFKKWVWPVKIPWKLSILCL